MLIHNPVSRGCKINVFSQKDLFCCFEPEKIRTLNMHLGSDEIGRLQAPHVKEAQKSMYLHLNNKKMNVRKHTV